MSDDELKLLDVVAMTDDVPEHLLVRGQMGTVVEIFEPGVYLVVFSDRNGETYAMASLRAEQLMLLRKEPVCAA